jgi:hypothetical protein
MDQNTCENWLLLQKTINIGIGKAKVKTSMAFIAVNLSIGGQIPGQITISSIIIPFKIYICEFFHTMYVHEAKRQCQSYIFFQSNDGILAIISISITEGILA